MYKFISFLILNYLIHQLHSLDNGLSITPTMGWNTWNKYGCSISEDIILNAAASIKAHGLDKLGYTYINIDDCWQASKRGPGNVPLSDPQKFPAGIKDLANRIHAMGLKLGIYSDAGTYTCGKRYGSLGFEEIDAKAYADWGVDYLKYDNCYNEGLSGTPQISATRYRTMRDALNATGRPIVYSLCQWGEDSVWNWASTIANSWRMSGDIYDNFDRPDDRCPCKDSASYCPLAGFHCSVMNILEKAAGLGQKAVKGGWNDLDMLEVGNGGMSYDEYVTHFSMWALAKSPLILGNDVTQMSNETLSIISNKEIIALNQDPESDAGYRIWKVEDPSRFQGSLQLWKSHLSNGTYALAFLNATPKKLTHAVSLKDFFIDDSPSEIEADWKFQDLWEPTRVVSITTEEEEEPIKPHHEFLPTNEDPEDEMMSWTHKKSKTHTKMIVFQDVPAHGVRVLKLIKNRSPHRDLSDL